VATGGLKPAAATQHIPIIALTAHAMQGDEQKALEAGCNDYDTKPVNFQRLLGKIETFLGA
jgi:CheY-like chemotaxis protein